MCDLIMERRVVSWFPLPYVLKFNVDGTAWLVENQA